MSFFADARGIWNERETRVCLIGLAGLRGFVVGVACALLFRTTNGELFFSERAAIVVWVVIGMVLGSLCAGIQKHPRRRLALVPMGGMGLAVTLMFAADEMSSGFPSDLACAAFGFMVGLVNFALSVTYQIALPANARGSGMAIRSMIDFLFAAATFLVLARYAGVSAAAQQLWLIAAVALLATLAAWWIFRREVVEQIIEFVFFVLYRFRAAGPGVDTFPLRGPVLVVANHSGYLDPMWLAKVIPRSLIPMMTSIFFDKAALRWTMVYLADAIRVQDSGFRREVPELQTAVAALDAGKCLVIFPEGRLRRTEEQPLKLFGQGVWHILRDRPNTPVVVCWIEGGWGSYFSYFNGPPLKNKKLDIRHPISVAVGAPHLLSAETLVDHLHTRQYLMEQCGQARTYLGLEPAKVPPMELEAAEESTGPNDP